MRCPDIWLNIILGVSVSVFLEDRALSTAYFLPQYRWTLANTLRAQENKKVEKVEFSFSASLPDLSSVLCPWTRNYIIFSPVTQNWARHLCSQLSAESRSWELTSIVMNQSFIKN
jgi:hypothetical protein